MTRTPWRPLLTGQEADAARERVRSIAESFQAPEGDDALTHGDIALFLAQLAVDEGSASLSERALSYLASLMGLSASKPLTPALYGGFTGIAWTTGHVQRLLMPSDDTDLLLDVDEGLVRLLRRPVTHDEFDLVSGLAGYGVYLLSRRSAAAAEGVAMVVEHLRRLAVPQEGGVAWFLPPRILSERAAEVTPAGRYDLGLAHGSAGVIAFLAAVSMAGTRPRGRFRCWSPRSAGWFASDCRRARRRGFRAGSSRIRSTRRARAGLASRRGWGGAMETSGSASPSSARRPP